MTKVQKQSQPKNFLASGKLRQWWQNMSDRYDRFVYPTLSESDQYFRVG
ncbi:MAG: hypothetical protein H6766_04845 [Candidatus Peribacteria bacterium]|nr:MAG: hypothetical protein H6766_04845 [Candidatus Peribacteria bacterium]